MFVDFSHAMDMHDGLSFRYADRWDRTVPDIPMVVLVATRLMCISIVRKFVVKNIHKHEFGRRLY